MRKFLSFLFALARRPGHETTNRWKAVSEHSRWTGLFPVCYQKAPDLGSTTVHIMSSTAYPAIFVCHRSGHQRTHG